MIRIVTTESFPFLRTGMLVIALLLMAGLQAGAQTPAPKTFSGFINDQYAIRMTLQQNGSELSGSYVYVKVGRPIRLKGRIEGKDNFVINELDENGRVTAVFKGVLIGQNKLSGSWSKAGDSKVMSFIASVRNAPAPSGVDDRAVIEERNIFREDEGKFRHVFSHPVVSGLKNQATLSKVQSLLNLKNVFDVSLTQLKEGDIRGITGIDYTINYNENYLLDVTFQMETMGAYPDTSTRQLVVNLRTGERLKAAEVFNPSALKSLAEVVDKAMQADIQKTLGEEIRENLRAVHFQTDNLGHFSISEKGLTFLYEFGFPHVIKAAEPAGSYLFTWQQLKPYVRRDGPLGVFIR